MTDLQNAIQLVADGHAERIAMPGRFRVWREGATVHCEIWRI
jgi:hypothetical protein